VRWRTEHLALRVHPRSNTRTGRTLVKQRMASREFKPLSTQLFRPWPGAWRYRPFSLRQYVIDQATRNLETIALRHCASNAQVYYVTQGELHDPAKQPRRLALERWESEGGATRLKSPRADHSAEL